MYVWRALKKGLGGSRALSTRLGIYAQTRFFDFDLLTKNPSISLAPSRPVLHRREEHLPFLQLIEVHYCVLSRKKNPLYRRLLHNGLALKFRVIDFSAMKHSIPQLVYLCHIVCRPLEVDTEEGLE